MLWSILRHIDVTLLGGQGLLPLVVDIFLFVCGILLLVGSGARRGYSNFSLVVTSILMMLTPSLYLVVGMARGVGVAVFFVSLFISMLNEVGMKEYRDLVLFIIFWTIFSVIGLTLFCQERSSLLVGISMLFFAMAKSRIFQRSAKDIIKLLCVFGILLIYLIWRMEGLNCCNVVELDLKGLELFVVAFGVILSAMFNFSEKIYVLSFCLTVVLAYLFGIKPTLWIFSCSVAAIFLFYPMAGIIDRFLRTRFLRWASLIFVMAVFLQMSPFFDYILLKFAVDNRLFLYGVENLITKDDVVLVCDDFNPIVYSVKRLSDNVVDVCGSYDVERIENRWSRAVYVIGRDLREATGWDIIKKFYERGYELSAVFYNYVLDPVSVLSFGWPGKWYLWRIAEKRGSCDEQDSCSAQA